MKTFNKFLEEVNPEPPEPTKEDPSMKAKEKRQMQIKKQVLLKKMQAVRSGAGSDIVASHTPDGKLVEGKKKGLDGKACWDGYKLSGTKKKGGKTVDNCVKVNEGDVHSGQGEKIQKRTKKWMDKKGMKGAPGLDAMKARTAEHKAKRGEKRHPRDQKELDRAKAFIKKNPNFGKVSEGTDKAFEYVKKQIAAKYGKSGYVSKDNPRKPQTDAEKAKVRAHQAKIDKENAAARAKDPSQGRYPKG